MRPLPAALLVLFATTVGCGLLTDFGGLSNPPDEPTVTDAAVAREDAAAAREDASAPDAEPGALPTYVAEVLKDQPITYLRFEEPSGAGVKDEMGRQDGTCQGLVERGLGGVLGPDAGNAIRLPDVEGSSVSLGDAFDFDGNAKFSVEVWIRPEIVDDRYRLLATKTSADGRDGWTMGMIVPLGVNMVFTVDGGTNGFGSNGGIDADKWNHVVATYDGTTVILYRNGAFGGAKAISTGLRNTTGSLILGMLPSGFNRFKGRMDELAIYDHALDPTRVKAHYDAATGK